jgi:hypothetical protein
MTPREMFAAIEAVSWRLEREHRRDAWLAWHIAALSRAKRMPPLQRLIAPGKARALDGEELERRRAEHREIVQKIDVGRINEAVKQRGIGHGSGPRKRSSSRDAGETGRRP